MLILVCGKSKVQNFQSVYHLAITAQSSTIFFGSFLLSIYYQKGILTLCEVHQSKTSLKYDSVYFNK